MASVPMHSRSSVVAYRSSARCLTRGFELRRTSRLRCRGASPSTNPESDGKPRVDVNSDGTSKGEQPQPSKPSKVPVDTPLRQANREVAYGVLTVRAVATLIVYLQETNLHLAGWLVTFIRRNPINLAGSAEEASGAAFIKKMLAEPIQPALWDNGVDPMHATTNGCHVDPRSMAQRILAIRAQLATEVRQDMKSILEDNEEVLRRLQRSALESSFKLKTAITAAESN